MKYPYARRMEHLKASEVRELLKVTENRDIISFGGGLPAPELFPLEEIREVSRMVLDESGREALQYSTTEGYAPLRAAIADRMNRTLGTHLGCDRVLVTSGSQQGLDLTGKVFLDEGDTVLCESPTYLSAISAFRAYGCRFVEVDTDDDGMLPDALEAALRWTDRVKLIYAIPNFQNPTGRSWSRQRRQRLIELAQRHGVIIVEDNPYGELRFEGRDLPSAISYDQEGVVHLGTFSKIFCPGYRIGWVAGPQEFVAKYALAKQGTDLHTNTLAQREIVKYLELYDIDAHIADIRTVYRRRRDLAIGCMEERFPQGVTFTRPQGGLFLWVRLPEGLCARALLERSLKRSVAFVPGGSLLPQRRQREHPAHQLLQHARAAHRRGHRHPGRADRRDDVESKRGVTGKRWAASHPA